MPKYPILLATGAALALGACAKKEVAEAPPPPPPVQAPVQTVAAPVPMLPPGAVPGSTAADRDGDGIVDGYYTQDGIYHPATAPAAPARYAMRSGERG